MLVLCKEARIYEVDGSYVCDARVVDRTGDIVRLQIGNMLTEFEQDQLRENYYDVKFFDMVKGVISTRVKFNDIKMSNLTFDNTIAECQVIEVEEPVQRRHDICVQMNSASNISRVMNVVRFNHGATAELVGDIFTGHLRDISAGGLYFQCSELFEEHEIVSIEFEEIDDIKQALLVEILRIDDYADKNRRHMQKHYNFIEDAEDEEHRYKYGYGCSFVKLSSSMESSVRRKVLDENRRQVKEQRAKEAEENHQY